MELEDVARGKIESHTVESTKVPTDGVAKLTVPSNQLGMLARQAPLSALSVAVLSPLIVALNLYGTVYTSGQDINGQVLITGILAALLASYLLDGGRQLFRQGQRSVSSISAIFLRWLLLLTVMRVLHDASGFKHGISPYALLIWAISTPLFLLVSHETVRHIGKCSFTLRRQSRTAIVVGASAASGRELAKALERQKHLGITFIGFFDDRCRERVTREGSNLLGRMDEVAEYVSKHQIKDIFITLPMASHPRTMALLDALKDTTASVHFIPDLIEFDPIQARLDHLFGTPVVSICESPLDGARGVLKRVFDILISSLLIVLICPLTLIVSVAVKLTSPGPIIFKQRRYGLNGKDITIYKFRTMVVEEDGDDVHQATRGDSRVTSIGAFLRHTSLDELPQLLNVLQGRMSLVGPRPHASIHNEQYRKLIKGYMLRHKVRPGLTGWAQVNGLRGETEKLEKMQARVDHDLDYLRHWSILLDIKIIAKTITIILLDRNAY